MVRKWAAVHQKGRRVKGRGGGALREEGAPRGRRGDKERDKGRGRSKRGRAAVHHQGRRDKGRGSGAPRGAAVDQRGEAGQREGRLIAKEWSSGNPRGAVDY